MIPRVTAALLAVLTLALASPAVAQTLGIDGRRLTVDGAPRFLVFISYFDAMRRANTGGTRAFEEDFGFFKGTVDGIRILVNWCHRGGGGCRPAADTLFDAQGRIQDAGRWTDASMNPWDRFVAVLRAAKTHGLLVNVTFTRETFAEPPSLDGYGAGIRAVAAKLEAEHPGEFRHLFFDIQNEWTKHREFFNAAALRGLAAAARAGRADAIVTGSQESTAPAAAAAQAREAGFDLVAFHDCRGCGDWHSPERIGSDAAKLSANDQEMPIVYDEPPAYCAPGVSQEPCRPGDSGVPGQFVSAALGARAAGIAMWTFHTRGAFDLSRGSYVSRASAAEQGILKEIRRRLASPATSSK